MSATPAGDITRLSAGIPGLELITCGGLPENRLTLVAGTAGSGKTVFAAQFLAAGIEADGAPGVFVTFEERPEATRRNMRSLGMDIAAWEADDKWRFVNASPKFTLDVVIIGHYDLSALVERVKKAVQSIGAKRVAIDSIGALIAQYHDHGPARQALFQLAAELEELGVTSVMTAERPDDYGPVSRYGFEEFVADNVILLRNALGDEKRRRTIEILKLRGGRHLRGEHLFTVHGDRGMVVVPQDTPNLSVDESSETRLHSGNAALDEMLRGGLYDRSLVLVSGPTGVGKSLMATQFIAGGVRGGERALLLSFEESRAQLHRNAAAWGLDFGAMERAGRLRLACTAPEEAPLEDHLLEMQQIIEDFEPDRVAIDSLTALQRISTVRSFREYLLGLTFHVKSSALLGLMTVGAHPLTGHQVSDLHVSTISDTIITLRYVEIDGQTRRGLSVLKMRGSDHDKAVREYVIRADGMQIGEPLRDAPPAHNGGPPG